MTVTVTQNDVDAARISNTAYRDDLIHDEEVGTNLRVADTSENSGGHCHIKTLSLNRVCDSIFGCETSPSSAIASHLNLSAMPFGSMLASR
jgi:hypothetical protein